MAEKKQMKQNKTNQAAGAQSPKRVSRKDLKRKRMIKRILGFVALAAAIGVGFYFAMETLFVVRTIEVTGSDIFTPAEITEFMNIPQEENIFKVDGEALGQQLTEEFTYLETAKVIKRLPDRLEINLTDCEEKYYTANGDEYRVYSQSFKYLRNAAEPPVGAVWMDVELTDEEAMKKAQEIIALFKKYEMNDVTKISVSDESTVSAVYADRFEIKFGTMLDIEYKIKMCDKVLEKKISQDEKGTIDATQGGEIVYKRQ